MEITKVTWRIPAESKRKLREIAQVFRRSAGMQVSVMIDQAHKAMFPEEYDGDDLPSEIDMEVERRR